MPKRAYVVFSALNLYTEGKKQPFQGKYATKYPVSLSSWKYDHFEQMPSSHFNPQICT